MGSQSIFRCTYRLLITIMDREDRDLVRPRTHTASLVGTSMPTESMAVIGQGSPGETNILIG